MKIIYQVTHRLPFDVRLSFKAGLSRCLGCLLFVGVFASSGCTSIEPWVMPYERHLLADPIMAVNRHGLAAGYMNHVYQAREGARGAEGVSGGGCGCN
ncbi:MAG: DUF4266 domain-containing protein [Pseudomonadales bacterium]|nr:DUF4266 domain-containing protein [Pseudomonadales bacterium]